MPILRMLRTHGLLNAGACAGFSEAEAAELIASGAAMLVPEEYEQGECIGESDAEAIAGFTAVAEANSAALAELASPEPAVPGPAPAAEPQPTPPGRPDAAAALPDSGAAPRVTGERPRRRLSPPLPTKEPHQ